MIISYQFGEYYCKTCNEKNDSKSNGLLDPVIAELDGIKQVVGLECETCRSFMMFEKKK